MDEIKKYLKESLLNYISESQIKNFTHKIELKEMKQGEIVFSHGENPNYMYIICEGFIKISMNLTIGREQILYIYKKGDFIGAHNLLTNERYLYKGTCLKNSKIILIHRDDFNNILKKNNTVLLKILDESHKRIRRGEELIDRLSLINADMRVARTLIDMITVYGINQDEGILLNINMNREELASFAGITRETLSRKLSYFEELGLIKTMVKGDILLIDIKGLSKFTL